MRDRGVMAGSRAAQPQSALGDGEQMGCQVWTAGGDTGDRTSQPMLPPAAWESSTEGAGEGLQGLYSSHDKQAQHRAGRCCHQGRASPSCDLGAGTGTAERTGADAAGAEAKPGTSTAH